MSHWNPVHNRTARSSLAHSVGSLGRQVLSALGDQIADVPNAAEISRIKFDADETGNEPHRPLPLLPREEAREGVFRIEVVRPDADLHGSLQRGERPGEFDATSEAVIERMIGKQQNGVGGDRSGGQCAGRLSRSAIRTAVDQAFRRRRENQRLLDDGSVAPFSVLSVSGVLGGMDGAATEVEDAVVEFAQRYRVPVVQHSILVLPGTAPLADEESATANAAAAIRERAALASGRYERFEYGGNGMAPARELRKVRTYWLTSDTTNAPGEAVSVSLPQVVSRTARFLSLLATTDFGDRLNAKIRDFDKHAFEKGRHGELLIGRTFNIAEIVFDHERDGEYATGKLGSAALGQLRGTLSVDTAQTDVLTIVGTHRLREGSSYTDLSSALLRTRADGRPDVELVARARELLRASLGSGKPLEVAARGEQVLDATLRQVLPDAAARIEQASRGEDRRSGLLGRVTADIDGRIQKALATSWEGHAWAQGYVAQWGEWLRNATQLTSADRRARTERLQSSLARLKNLVENDTTDLKSLGFFESIFADSQFEHHLADVQSTAEGILRERLVDLAQEEAIELFRHIEEHVEGRTHDLDDLEKAITHAEGHFQEKATRANAWDGVLTLSSGLSLSAPADLDRLYARHLRAEDEGHRTKADAEQAAAAEVLAGVRKKGLLHLARSAGALAKALEEVVVAKLEPRVRRVHVQDELFRRYPRGSRELRNELRKLDRESFESVPLSGLVAHDDRSDLLRYVCGSGLRLAEITEELNAAAHGRQGGVRYEPVEIDDPQRIVLVQIRLSFPLSRLADLPRWEDHYAARLRAAPGEVHSELHMRYLPAPGVAATDADTKAALVKAHLVGALSAPGPIGLAYSDPSGTLGTLSPHFAELRDHGVRVEIHTRFFNDWRFHGPTRMLTALDEVAAACAHAGGPNGTLVSRVAAAAGHEGVAAVRGELEDYARSIRPTATWWGVRP